MNVNPGLINPKRLFNWEGTIFFVSDEMTTGEVPPNENKPWFSLIRGWHYIILSVHWKRKSELITVGDRKTIKLQLVFFFFFAVCIPVMSHLNLQVVFPPTAPTKSCLGWSYD